MNRMTGIRAVLGLAVGLLSTGLLPRPGAAQETALMEPAAAQGFDFSLTLKNVMRGTELVGEAPVGVSWSDDSAWIYFRWRPGGTAWHDSRDLYRVAAEGGEPEKLSEAAADSLAIAFSGGDISRDDRYRVTSVRGDLYLIDRGSGDVRRLTTTTDVERSPRFSSDGAAVFFRRGDNLFRLDTEDGSVTQMTDVRSGPEPPDPTEAEGQRGFLEDQQEELFAHLRIRQEREEEREATRERREEQEPETLYLDKDERVRSLDADPSGRYVLVQVAKQVQGAKQTIVPAWITESGYTEDLDVRTKVGDVQGGSRTGLLEVATGEIVWLDLWPVEEGEEEQGEEEQEEEEEQGEEEQEEEAEEESKTDTPKLSSGGFRGWNEAGTHALLTATSYDNENWRIYSLEAATGELTLMDSLHDEAWVGGPCFGFSGPCMGWIPGSSRAYYVSEETGWAQLYSVEADGSDKRALTQGDWEVRGVSIPQGWDTFLLHTSEASPFDTHAYRMDFDGSNRERLLDGEGIFQVTPSPDGRRLAAVYSRSNRPGELFVAPNRVGPGLTQVTTSPIQAWLDFPWKEVEIVEVPAEDGTRVPARIYRPEDMGARANGAGVIFVHGAGYLQNVHHGWSGYFREYMFHHFLAAQGYTVLDIDYRGSAGYGRDWRTAVYRWMGGKDLSDQVDGARYLIDQEGVEPGRLGIYGGSYGGFITLMALFTAPGTFEAGAALRSVTDWAHYNHSYTSRILNQPQDDEEAYRKSSPIYFAENFEGHLLMAHGMVDTNVHFSDVVRLSQRLIELGKENWELAVYPVENHGFVEPASWTDEYRRIYELFDRTIGRPPVLGTGGR